MYQKMSHCFKSDELAKSNIIHKVYSMQWLVKAGMDEIYDDTRIRFSD